MTQKLKLLEEDTIKPRVVGDPIPEIATVDPGLSQYNFGDLSSAVEFAKMMCQAGPMLPPHAQNNPAICLAITMRSTHWGFDPFALAQETYQATQGGPVAYQAKVFGAVARKAGIILQYRYEGELKMLDEKALSAKGNVVAQRKAVGDIKCIVSFEDHGVMLEYDTPTLDEITIKNSALWHNDPKQQLGYYAVRGWMRRHRPDLMMGAYSEEEVQQMEMRDVTPKQSGLAQLANRAREEAQASKDEPTQDTGAEAEAETVEHEQAEPQDYADTAEYKIGWAAAEGGLPRSSCPFRDDPDQGLAWLEGFDAYDPDFKEVEDNDAE